jgi:hypothetical protein
VDFFRGLLERAVDEGVVKSTRKVAEQGIGLSREEVRKAVRNLRDGKAEGGMAFGVKFGNMEGRSWKNRCESHVIMCGEERDG